MDSNILRKRRPFGQEDSPPESTLQPSSLISPVPDSCSESLSPRQQLVLGEAGDIIRRKILPSAHQSNYLLEEATALLGFPVNVLLGLRHQHQQSLLFGQQEHHYLQQSHYRPHSHKRQRLESDMPLFSHNSHNQDAQEKSPDATQQADRDDEVRGTFMGGIKECLGSVAMFPPCSGYEKPTTYQPVPSTASYEYASNRAYSGELTSPVDGQQPEYQPAPNTGVGQAGMYPVVDDPMVMAQLQRYPPLQPTNLSDQPTTHHQGMTYPEIPPNAVFFKSEDSGPDFQPSGLPGGDPMLRPGHSIYGTHDLSYMRPGMMHNMASSSSYDIPHGFLVTDGMSSSQLSQFELGSHGLGSQIVMPNHKAPPAKRGPFKDKQQREQTAHVRKIGSCIRCKMQRIRCEVDPESPKDESAPCLTCRRISSKVARLPCKRWKIVDLKLFKPGQVKNHEWTRRWSDNTSGPDVGNWASSEVRIIRVTEGYTEQFVELQVRKFIPQPGDKRERTWVENGEERRLQIPDYAIVNLEAAKNSYDGYAKRGLEQCCRKLLGPREKLLWRTYELAILRAKSPETTKEERELISSTLNLWMFIRLTTKSCEIVGSERLGMAPNALGQVSSIYTGVPLPPVMGAQIDAILLNHTLPKLRRDTLEMLQTITIKKQQKTWLTTYLVTFILLHNVALITAHDAGYAKKHGMRTQFAREDMVQQYHLGANVLLCYYHYCNKGVYPFSAECKDSDLQTLTELDEASIDFIKYTRNYATEHKREWDILQSERAFCNDYYFVSQLFEQNWMPRSTI